MGNKPFKQNKNKGPKQQNVRYDLENPYKEGWLWKQSRHLKKWRKRWIVINGPFIYTFICKKIYINPTEVIDLRYFTYLSKEDAFEEPQTGAQQKFANFKKRFSFKLSDGQGLEDDDEEKKEPIYLILLSDLNNDETFTFKSTSKEIQTHWIYSFERALEYKSNLIQTIIPTDIIKYIVSLYFYSYERIKLSQISTFFYQLFSYQNYNVQYHYYGDAKYWTQHFSEMIKQQINDKKNNDRNRQKIKSRRSLMFKYEDEEEKKQNMSLEELQFNEASFHLSSVQWNRMTKIERNQLKYFFILYHEFSAFLYQRIQKKQSDLGTEYVFRSRSRNRSYRRKKDRSSKIENKEPPLLMPSTSTSSPPKAISRNRNYRKERNGHHQKYANTFVNIKEFDNNKNEKSSSMSLHYNVRDKSRRWSGDDIDIDSDTSITSTASIKSAISSVCDDNEFISEDIIEELNKLDLKYENIRLDGYDWNKFFNKWVKYPFIKTLYIHCNIQTLHIGAASFYDEESSMITQLANNAIDLKIENNRKNSRLDYINHKYEQAAFWDNGGIKWLYDIIKYSYSFTSFLSTIRVLSLRDSNFGDKHLKLFCSAINSRRYESSKSLTLKKLILSKNFGITDATMNVLFTTIGNKLQNLEELELNDLGISDKIAYVLLDFYTDFHYNYNNVQLSSISLLGNPFTVNGFKIMNKLFENDIIDETKFIGRKVFHLGVNGRKNDIVNNNFDMRLHIVVISHINKLSIDD